MIFLVRLAMLWVTDFTGRQFPSDLWSAVFVCTRIYMYEPPLIYQRFRPFCLFTNQWILTKVEYRAFIPSHLFIQNISILLLWFEHLQCFLIFIFSRQNQPLFEMWYNAITRYWSGQLLFCSMDGCLCAKHSICTQYFCSMSLLFSEKITKGASQFCTWWKYIV